MPSQERVRTRLTVAAAIIATAALTAACSPGADFAGALNRPEFPAVLDRPEPRADKPMSPDQVKEVTDSLISDRDHLSAQAQPSMQASAPATKQTAKPATTSSTPAASTQTAGVAVKP